MLRFQKRFSSLSGTLAFTLTELLLAATITCSALAVSGMGLSAMISSSTAVNARTERQDELNRAMDFISAELRESSRINKGSVNDFIAGTNFKTDLSGVSVKESEIKEILWFARGSDKIVYYVSEPTSDSGPWRSPQVVYRWGPKFDSDGEYTTDTEHSILIDSLHDQMNGGVEPTCHSGWDKSPSTNAKELGFYACIAPGSRAASLFQVGRVNKVLGHREAMPEERQVYSRTSQTNPPAPLTPVGTPSTSCVGSGCGPTNGPPIEEDPKGYIVTTDLIELTIDNRGGAITCTRGGPPIPTSTSVEFTKPDGTVIEKLLTANAKETITNIPKNTTIKFVAERFPVTTANNYTCGYFKADSKEHSGTQVIALSNAQEVPYYEPYDRQSRIDEFLVTELPNNDSVLVLEPNSMVFLFELGEKYSSNPGAAYDFQDVVLVADMKPKPRGSQISVSAQSSTSITTTVETTVEVSSQ